MDEEREAVVVERSEEKRVVMVSTPERTVVDRVWAGEDADMCEEA